MDCNLQLIVNILLLDLILLFRFSATQVANNVKTTHKSRDNRVIKRIAIIGGGVGGSSSAYFLRQLLEKEDSNDISIDLFEKSSELGGRLATKLINDKHYETGGSIIHDKNRYAIDLVNKLNLSKRNPISGSERLCIYNGKSYVFCESNWKWITYFKIWLRYGFDVQKLQSKVSQIIDDFENIYRLQDNNVKFDSVEELLMEMSPTVNNLTKTRFDDYLMNSGLSKKFIKELVQSISLVNYGQDVSIPAFVGCVSFAGAGSQLWSIKGGNKLLPKLLAQNSNANIFLNTNVNSIKYLGPNLFEITASKSSGESYKSVYNSVIIAAPLIENEVNFVNFSQNINANLVNRKYHRTVSTLVSGTLTKQFRGRDVLTNNKSSFFTSIGRVYDVEDSDDEKVSVYKVFSPLPLTKEQLNLIFDDIRVIDVTDWFAYPQYDSISEPMPPFILFAGIYNINAIEWSASAIEMSLIGGKNAALLAYNQLERKVSNDFTEKVINKYISDEL